MPAIDDDKLGYPSPTDEADERELESMLYASHSEINSPQDLMAQRGTPIPALFNQFYKFIQNPSTVSVETFKRMVDTDDTIGSGVDFLTTCLAARIGEYSHESDEITDWVRRAFEQIQGGVFDAWKDMMSASWVGFSVQEKVWGNDPELGFIIKKLVSLPPGTILFETERTGELTNDGILQYQRNYNPANLSYGTNFLFGFTGVVAPNLNASRPDPFAKLGDLPFPARTANTYSYLSIRIPIEKCVHYAFNAQGRFGNPYGRSILRRAYKWYIMKDAFLQMLSVALDRKGTPLTIVFADPNVTLADPEKSPVGANMKGSRIGLRADRAAQAAFKNIHNDTTIILPGKKGQVFDTDFVPQASNAGDFMQAIDLCNRSLMRAMLIPSLIFTNGDGSGSYALGQEHAKTFDKILDGINYGVRQAILQHIVKPLLAYNFPESAWRKDGIGSFIPRELSQEEKDKEMDMVEKAVNMGAIDMNDMVDLNIIREKAGFPLRDKPIPKPELDLGGEDEEGNQEEPKDDDQNENDAE